ncbi:MAG: transcription-repair coupling factor [Bacillota bacterium]
MKDFLIDPLLNLKPYKKLLEDIESNKSPLSTHGLMEENLGHFLCGLKSHTNRQILLLTYSETRARQIFEDVKTILPEEKVRLYPSRDIILYDVDAFSSERTHQRLEVLSCLMENKSLLVIASVEALGDRIISRNTFEDFSLNIQLGKEASLKELAENLVSSGYERVSLVEQTGQFSIRGGILDVYPPNMEYPARVEFFDTEVDSIRTFDWRDQRSLEVIDNVDIYPVSEIIIPASERASTAEKLTKELKEFKERAESIEIREKAEEKFGKYLDSLMEGSHITNKDLLVPYLPKVLMGTVIDYFNKSSLIVLDEPKRLREKYEAAMDEFHQRTLDLFQVGEVLKSHLQLKYHYEDIVAETKKRIAITSASFLKQDHDYPPKAIVRFSMRTIPVYHGKLDVLKEDLDRYLYKGYKIIILVGTRDRGMRLKDALKEIGISSEFYTDRDSNIQSGQVFIAEGSLRAGFEYEELKLSVITDKEIYGVGKKKAKKKSRKTKDSGERLQFSDLNEGDYVVHENYGIGQYLGVSQLAVQGIKKDYLLIQYRGKDRLYLPIEQMSMIQKYIGSDSVKPKINKLSGSEWSRTKTRTKKAIEEMATDLLELYAKREKLEGYEFSPDTTWQREFEDMFPYEETQGQKSSIEEIKVDMENKKPMDRLLCGDVGYGKTEVALRAAFKAVMDSKQVAILVPTTILAQQHYNTIVERLGDFPISVAMLSRFRTRKEQQASLEMLRKGLLDIVVGTHRLLSKDVVFKDLGLLVVDEEQRFGVKHKEKLKKIKENVDVLTLTATPIPRTLHMSLVGIRDMSVIEEPPEERYPIQTYVTEYNKTLVRDAIQREISRGGQVYYVYNRVETIDKITMELREMVPEADFVIAHGQMAERELEQVMLDFMNKETNVLVCTTIIETGLDIPNVNTIIIHDSDKFGLSQLYQLRGRVGRSNRLAFSYFVYQKDKVLSEVAEKRLRAIKEFTEFGSGFKIAMRDLEIRGAGNLLGVEQHGNIETIGYDLYVKYLGQAVKKLKGDIIEEKLDTTVDIQVDGYISASYIPDEEQKIEIYKRISTIESIDDYRELIDELIDRFGDLPKPVENLMNISYIRGIGSRNHITNIIQIDRKVRIDYENGDYIKLNLIQMLTEKYGPAVSFDLSNQPSITLVIKGDIINRLKEFLEAIDNFTQLGNSV